jgi:hypothetical protein
MVEKPSKHSPLPNRILLLELYEGSSLPQLCDKDCPAVAPVRRPHDVTCKHDQDTSHKVSQFLVCTFTIRSASRGLRYVSSSPYMTHTPPHTCSTLITLPQPSPNTIHSCRSVCMGGVPCMKLCKAVRHEGNGYSIHVTDRCVDGGHAIDRPWT